MSKARCEIEQAVDGMMGKMSPSNPLQIPEEVLRELGEQETNQFDTGDPRTPMGPALTPQHRQQLTSLWLETIHPALLEDFTWRSVEEVQGVLDRLKVMVNGLDARTVFDDSVMTPDEEED